MVSNPGSPGPAPTRYTVTRGVSPTAPSRRGKGSGGAAEAQRLGPLDVVEGPLPLHEPGPVGGDQDRRRLALDPEAAPRLEAVLPEHPERDPVPGHEPL